jgi:hypothetical protein
MRDGQCTYLCFVDLEKAYDNVWRDGLWCRLRRVGVRGKVLRIIQQLYVDVQSRYVVNDAYVTPWVTLWKGVRQGCVLSPLLFNIYIDDLLREIERVGGGIKLRLAEMAAGSRDFQLNQLGYADDIVMISGTVRELQQKVLVLESWCRRWRSLVNTGKTKVMKTSASLSQSRSSGEVPLSSATCTYRGEALETVQVHTYLGVQFRSDYSWSDSLQGMVERATTAMNMVAAAGISRGMCSVTTAERWWQAMVRSVLEYAAPAICARAGDWKQAEAVQHTMGCSILRVHRRSAGAAVRGELGWQRLSVRRQVLMLQYWYRLETATGAKADRYTVQTYRAERVYLSARLGDGAWSGERCVAGRLRVKHLFTGCVEIILSRMQMQEQFSNADRTQPIQQPVDAGVDFGAKAFLRQLRERAKATEELRWRAELASLSSLTLYRKMKQQLVREEYLTVAADDPRLSASVRDRCCIVDMTRLRCGVADIALVSGRRTGVERQQRYCRWCEREWRRSGGLLWCRPVEDEEHILLQCGAYDALRRELDDDIAEMTASERIVGNRLVRTGGIRLLAVLQSHCHDDRLAQADAEWVLAFILAGCILRDGERWTPRHDALRAVVLQRCKRYCGEVMRARKEWLTEMDAKPGLSTDEDSDEAD